jgi:signal transduction histidine kinase/ligand-binding sensor domain-containing protein/DNA-binding response OmpR family regulator
MMKKALFLTVLLYTAIFSRSNESELWFRSLSLDDGLSESTVQTILQDRKGLLWFGTRDGLNRFNGYDFTVYNYNENDLSTVSSNYINCLFEDSQGRIWVGTNSNGVCYYDYDQDNFTRIGTTGHLEQKLANTTVWDIIGDKSGNIWIATVDGLFRYCVKEKKIVDHFQKTGAPGSLVDNNIRSLVLDSAGNLWMGTDDGGICMFNRQGNTFMCFGNNPGDPGSISSNHIRKLYLESDTILWIGTTDRGVNRLNIRTLRNTRYVISSDGRDDGSGPLVTGFSSGENGAIWISTENQGLKTLDPVLGDITTFLKSSYSTNSIASNSLVKLMKDRDGIIWAGAVGHGVAYFYPNKHGVKRFQHIPFDNSTVAHNNIRSFYEDYRGNIWVGTDGGGIDIFDNDWVKQSSINKNTPGVDFSSNVAMDIQSDGLGTIWIATWGDGLLQYNPTTKLFRRFSHDPRNVGSLSSNQITSLYIDKHDDIWVSCFKGGLHVRRKGADSFEKIRFDDNENYERASYYITSTFLDSSNNFWVTSFEGLFLKMGNVSLNFRHDMSDTTSISSNMIHCVYEDSMGRIWVGTNNKLNLFDRESRIFLKFGDREGFPSNVIYSIVEDADGYLWLSTNKGIVRFDAETRAIRKFNTQHGLQSAQFNLNASLKLSNGSLLFGGISGFNLVDPLYQAEQTNNPRVLLSGLYLFNSLQRPGAEGSPLPRHISEVDQLVLRHSDRAITIEFVGLNFFSPRHTEYAYRLMGFEKGWNYAGSERMASYTNLNPGKYIFEVMARQTDQDWDYDITSIEIVILPPFWKTNIALAMYVISIFLALLFLRLFVMKKERVRMKEKFDRYRVKKAQEMEAMRIRFFTNISHDLRTPLTLILAPFEKLLKTETDEEKKYQIGIVYKNALRMERLINQLLDLRKQETSSLKLNLSQGDLSAFLGQIVESFRDMAQQKNIDFHYSGSEKPMYLMFDRDKLDKIMFNLLSNAFKFTLNGGQIRVQIAAADRIPLEMVDPLPFEKYACITVSDNGKGIPAELHEKVFERFYHINDTFYSGIEGTGIGLSLSKDYVELHGGKILLESEPGKGSRFMVYIPYRQRELEMEGDLSLDEDESADDLTDQQNGCGNNKPVALVVEDNHELLDYIKGSLSRDYKVIAADNGKAGLDAAFEHIPDIVITDIMMAAMDGVELTRSLKKDLRTSHIPIILLTARSSDAQKLEGLNAGADDYITKPFSFEILEARMQNLLQMRDHIREKYSRFIKFQTSEVEVENQDEKFLRKVMQVLEHNLTDPDFSVEKLSHELGLSRVHLYRKLSALINETPVEFIRSTRLERGAQLLLKSGMNISEVCYEVGFQNPVYFSKCFKRKYGMLPSEYIAKSRE